MRSSGSVTRALAGWARSSTSRPWGRPRPSPGASRSISSWSSRPTVLAAARRARRVLRGGRSRGGDAGHPARRHLGGRRARQGGHRLPPRDPRGALGAAPGRQRVRVLAAEVRRRGDLVRPRAQRDERLHRRRVRLRGDGQGGGDHDDGVSAPRGGGPPALHDQALRPPRRRQEAAHADARRASRTTTSTRPAPTPTSRRCR